MRTISTKGRGRAFQSICLKASTISSVVTLFQSIFLVSSLLRPVSLPQGNCHALQSLSKTNNSKLFLTSILCPPCPSSHSPFPIGRGGRLGFRDQEKHQIRQLSSESRQAMVLVGSSIFEASKIKVGALGRSSLSLSLPQISKNREEKNLTFFRRETFSLSLSLSLSLFKRSRILRELSPPRVNAFFEKQVENAYYSVSKILTSSLFSSLFSLLFSTLSLF